MNEITIEELISAYIKLKSHIYYDTSEQFQRRKLAIFETGTSDDQYENNNNNIAEELQSSLNEGSDAENINNELKIPKFLYLKFVHIVDIINQYHSDESKFAEYFEKIKLIYLPKKFKKDDNGDNYLSNKRVQEKYNIDRITVFADLPIELHLVSILWLTKYGFRLDAKLGSCCVGNRLLLNKKRDGIVKGSGLFKPYFKQYQKWRDQSVEEAQRKLQNDSNVAFINLDIKDYFYSVRINFDVIEKDVFGEPGYTYSNIHNIFKKLHICFTEKLAKMKYPNKFIEDIPIGNVVLPIGLTSSYVLANYYLHDFDNRIKKLIPHVYYSRYVDDILIVVENPDFYFHENERCDNIKFSFEKYKEKENIKFVENKDDYYSNVSKTERFILETLYPLVKLIDLPPEFQLETDSEKNKGRIFKISCLKGAYFQGQKTLLYYFDKNESTVVIDKLKQELEERASEFRDFPEDEMGESSFEEQAYHLIFDGTEGKIRTLKDYKENRYGLSVYLANRIFAALRQSKKVDKDEANKLLKLFKGLNNLEHFRLWEKILTFFMVNDNREGFFAFYEHTLELILKLKNDNRIQSSNITHSDVADSLLMYLDISFEMVLALYPDFIREGTKSYKDFQFLHSKAKKDASNNIIDLLSPASGKNLIKRFRISNLIRHHYVAHPLLNYTNVVDSSNVNLVDRNLSELQKLVQIDAFPNEKKALSPRFVKFWECCIAETTKQLFIDSKLKKSKVEEDGRYSYTNVLNSGEKEHFLLDDAFKLYTEINAIHFKTFSPNKEDLYERISKMIKSANGENEVRINELHINSSERFEENPKISIANTEVKSLNIESSIKGKPNLSKERYAVFAKLLNESRKEKANIVVLPECSVPYELVSSFAKYSEKNQMAIIAGLEHWKIDDVCYNFIVSIIPVKINGVNDTIVLYRLKNHYAHMEELIIRGYGYKVPKPKPYRYDLINWRNLYFTSFYCFELADTFHRSIFRSKIDLLIASEWNKDTPYFSNIVEALSRDLHCYIAQVNTSEFGDSRLTQPSESARKDIMKLKGGKNDTILVEKLNIATLREFQLKHYERIKADKNEAFKPVPPDWNRKDVNNRIDNKKIFTEDKEECIPTVSTEMEDLKSFSDINMV